MKHSRVILIIILSVFFSCKNGIKTSDNTATKESISKPINAITPNSKKQQQPLELLTKVQFNDFFPDYLGSNKRYNIFVMASEALATASYGDFKDTFNYSLTDGIKNTAVVKNFELSYTSDLKGPEGTEYIKMERDGYKTIAFLQPKINRYSIEFIYDNRFKLVIEGSEHPDVLWTYVKKSDLQKLDSY